MKKLPIIAPLFAAGLGVYCAGSDTGGFDPNAGTPPLPPVTDPSPSCSASQTYSATQTPAAMLAVLDMSESMSEGNKWQSAGQAIVQVFDQDVFDSMSVGLLASPSGTKAAPSCVSFFIPRVACLSPSFAQIPLTPAGVSKSGGPSGVRRDIKTFLANNSPDTTQGDASPLYDAIKTGISELKSWGTTGKRILMVVTDGSISCTSLSNPQRPAYQDGWGCYDWENPDNIIGMLRTANQDTQKPIETFIVGVPGADTYDPSASSHPPYRMRAALSAMAYAGAPSHVPTDCTGRAYSQTGADPTVSCHFDLTQGALSPQTLASAIATARGKVAGCSYDLPRPEGVEVDKSKVNVSYTIGATKKDLVRRMDPNNTCASDGCWDYTSDGKVQLVGKACSDVQSAASVDVKVTVGCTTIVG